MKVKDLKAWLSILDDNEEVILNVAGETKLSSIFFGKGGVYLCGHNFGCNDNEITLNNVLTYLKQKNEKK